MARLLTAPFEGRLLAVDGLTSVGTVTFDTTNQFDGSVCAKCAKAAENRVVYTKTLTLGTTYYLRAAIKCSEVAPSANLGLIRFSAASNSELTLNTNGKIYFWNGLKSKNELEAVFAPEAGKHYLYELKVLIPSSGSSTLALRIYDETGKTVYNSGDKTVELGNTAISSWTAGHIGTDNSCDIYLSHLALNDSTGTAQNSFAGWAKVVELKPVEDGERVGWTTPGSGTTNLFKALDNRPPEGIADTTKEENKEKQIRDANNNTTDTYVAVLGAYTDPVASGGGGLSESAKIQLTVAVARGANTTTTARELKVRSESNPGPDAAEGSLSSGTTAAGTEPTGWSTLYGTVNYAPTVTKATRPKVRVRKGTASTNTMLYDLAGLIVEFVPGVSYEDSRSGAITLTGSKVESNQHSGSRVGVLTPSGSAKESAQATSARSGTITVSGARAETYGHVSAQLGTITLSGTSIEQLHAADALSGTITASGVVTEESVASDSPTGEIYLLGPITESASVDAQGFGAIAVEAGPPKEAWGFTESSEGVVAISGTTEAEEWGFSDSLEGAVSVTGTATETFGIHLRDQLADPPSRLVLSPRASRLAPAAHTRTVTPAGGASRLHLNDLERTVELDNG